VSDFGRSYDPIWQPELSITAAHSGVMVRSEASPKYQNPIQNTYGHCRIRRKRERLTSNGSIETDAAVGHYLLPEESCAASLPIEF
jgi:hypothetical protein